MDVSKKPINEIKQDMNNDFLDVRNAEGMPALIDSTIAMDFLLSSKIGIKDLAFAITETANRDARETMIRLLEQGIDLHTEITNLMLKKGWFHPYQVKEQFELDDISSETAMKIAGMELFPGDTSRLGTFATPNY